MKKIAIKRKVMPLEEKAKEVERNKTAVRNANFLKKTLKEKVKKLPVHIGTSLL
jgi:hypothetical protein